MRVLLTSAAAAARHQHLRRILIPVNVVGTGGALHYKAVDSVIL